MGRRPNAPTQKADGYWYSRHPGLRKTVRLAATSFAEAVAEQQSFYGVVVEPTQSHQVIPGDSVSTDGGDGAVNLDDDEPTAPGKKADSAADLLAGWAKSTAPMAETTTNPVAPTQSVQAQANSIVSHHPLPTVGVRPLKVQKGLTPEQTAKIASGLKKMVVNINVVAVGAAIEMFGVVPAPLDHEEIQLLQMGWELWLDELFQKAKLKPVYLVIAGNIMIAVSMYASGTKKIAPMKVDPTAAKGQSNATVTPIHPATPPKG